MALESDIEFLSKVPLFSDFGKDHLRLLAFGSESIRFSSGRTLFREGDVADCAYVVVSGTIRLTHQRKGQTVTLRDISKGVSLGELALLTQTKRNVTATAVTDIETIRVGRSLVRRILDEYPELAMPMYREISNGLRTMIREITKLEDRFAS